MEDATLGGYLKEHERPPAFTGADGGLYTVEILTERQDAEASATWHAYLFFLRWRGTEAVGHRESEFLSDGESESEARAKLERLSLYEVKAVLDRTVRGGQAQRR